MNIWSDNPVSDVSDTDRDSRFGGRIRFSTSKQARSHFVLVFPK